MRVNYQEPRIRISEKDKVTAKSIDIEDYISKYVIPKDKGYFEEFNRASMIRCPLHREDTASFKVYQDTNTWHCFGGCGTGDIISFIMKYEELGFKEAVLFLLDKAGESSTFESEMGDIEYGFGRSLPPHKGEKLKINDGSSSSQMLPSDRAAMIIRADRVKTLELYEKFCRLLSIEGMTPDSLIAGMNVSESRYYREFIALDDAYTDYVTLLNGERFNEKAFQNLLPLRSFHSDDFLDLLKDQLAFYILEGHEVQHPKWEDEMYTFGTWSKNTAAPIFYNSYVFPVFGLNGKVLGMTSYQPNGKSKYLYATSPYVNRNDLIYHKRGFKDWAGVLIVCEGVFDALRVMSLGFDNVISTLGAHESLLHKRVLSRAKHLVIIPDRDAAGKKITKYWRECNPNSSILYVPYGRKDVDEFCAEGIYQEQMFVNELKKAVMLQSPGAEFNIIL